MLTTEGPVLMLAGAGTGKTAALTARLAHLIAMRKAWPSQILAVTFTNKAAREMKERIAHISGGAIEGMPWLGTFHSVAARMLRSHAELVGLQSNFTILDTDDQLRLLKQLILAANLDEKRWPARQLAGLIDRWKNRGLTPALLDAAESEAFAQGRGQEFYAAYQARLRTLNACDFGDLLLHMLTIFKAHPDVLQAYRDRFHYILVDEYQDTNASQYDWLTLLAEPRRNLCCVGDDDQSIYSWRGAEVANILRFEKDFPGAAIIRLEQNYRSTPHILGAAAGLIANNSGRLGKTLWTTRNDGDRVKVIGVWDGPEEARRVGEEVERHAPRRRQPRRLRHPRPRPVPDARVRGALHRDRPRLPDHRRLPLLRARRDPRRARLPPPDRAAQRRPRLRTHRQHAQARPRRQGRAADPRLRPRHRPAPAPRRRANARQRRNDPAGAQVARPLRRRRHALADDGRDAAPPRACPPDARRERLHRRAPGRAHRPKPRDASKTSPSSPAPWKNMRRSAPSSSMSAW